ncbi:MAG: AraC family transcriptional regulator [Prevotellaceae bacterium]|jgi:AraC-like DNA-binding protein|nr:AraC family transcriptional regulator [Prevotellaceae bacterium]
MARHNLNILTLKNAEQDVPNGINNFIVSGPGKLPYDFSPDYPYFFEGIVLGLCIKGEATIRIHFKEHKITKNTTLAILPMQIFKIVDKSDDLILECLFFTFDFFVGLVLPTDYKVLFNISKKPCLTVSDEVALNLLNYHNFIVRQYHLTNKAFRTQIIRGLLYSLLLETVSLYKKENEANKDSLSMTRQEEITAKFFELLMANYREERNVSFYADKLCFTNKYLSSIIKEVTGSPISRWIDEFVITAIKIRLKTTNMSVLQISEEFNFPNPSFFGQFFKRYTGTTPNKFKNE